MSVDRDAVADREATVGRIRGSVAPIERPQVAAAARVVAAALMLAMGVVGLRHGEPFALWLVPVAWALLASDSPPVDRER